MNLLINARQAMPGGGRVLIKLAYDAESDMIDLVVRDNGCGIPAEKLPRIFDPFYTTKSGPDASGKGGTGLGLSMCRDIIEAHHGRIRVDSTVGKGTAFTLEAAHRRQGHGKAAVAVPLPMASLADRWVPAMAGGEEAATRAGGKSASQIAKRASGPLPTAIPSPCRCSPWSQWLKR